MTRSIREKSASFVTSRAPARLEAAHRIGADAVADVRQAPPAQATLHLEDLWIKDVTITTGLVATCSTPTLLWMTAAGRLPTRHLVTHTFPLGQMEEAYDVFANAAETGALKVVLGEEQYAQVAVPTP